ncbi:MAG TPA: hypothetical protein VGF48_16505 [Thermoanaerobaculia bacterium]|jgi:hypothetical protein
MQWRAIALLLLTAAIRADVRVTIRGTDGRLAEEAYVAFLAADHPSSRPAAEALATRGVVALEVPPGTYLVRAAGRGLQEETRSVRVNGSAEVAFALPAAVPMQGIVLDGEGKPIENAQVSQLRALGPVQLAQTTELARRHFANEWSTRTDADGRWTLPGRSDATVALLFEAEGFAPLHAFRAATDSSAVTLQRGAQLRVKLARTEPGAYVTLVREGAEGWERAAWARAADAESLVWSSLPLGNYTLVAADFDPRTFASRTQLAAVELQSDATIDLTIPQPPKPMLDAVTLFVNARELRDLEAIVSSGGTASVVAHALERTVGGTLIHLATTAPRRDLFLTTADSVLLARDAAPVAVSPRADVRVRLTGTGPRWMTAQFSGCAEGQRPSLAVQPSAEGAIDLPVPTACRALLLRAEGYAPIVISTTIAANTMQTFGPFALKPAGSARVRVVREPGGKAAAKVVVQASVSEGVVAEGITDDSGNVTLNGLPVDTDVTFTAETGIAVARLEPREIAVVDPLVIRAAATLTIKLRLVLPDAKITSVVLENDAVRHSATPVDGAVVFRELRPGAWRPQVLVEAAGSVQPVPLEVVELHAGETRSLDAEVDPPLFEGQIVAAGKPLAAHVGFGDGTMRRFARTDSTGRFTIVLPKRGMYNVTVAPLDRPGLMIDAGEIDFSDRLIQIPAAALRVRVLENGQPLPNAEIRASLRRSSALEPIVTTSRVTNSDARGEALLEGLLTGRWLVQAVAPGGRAEAAVEVRDARAAVELRIAPPTALRGVVRHTDNSIESRARVDCLFAGASGLPQTVRTETDGEGRFAIDLPTPPPTRLQCGVTTANGRIAAYTLSPTSSADLVVPTRTAAVRFPDWEAGPNRDVYWLVSGDRLFNLSWSNGSTARLGAGSWKVVRVRDLADWTRLATLGGNALTPIREFRIEEGRTMTIRLHSDGGER